MAQLTRPQLRRYYERAYGAVMPRPDANETATFDEYYALARIGHAGLTPAAAAAGSRRPDFIKAAATYKQEPAATEPSLGKTTEFRRKPSLDLRKAVTDQGLGFLLLDRIPEVTGWEAAHDWSELKRVTCVNCGTPTLTAFDPLIDLDSLTVKSCSTPLLRTLLASFNARKLRVEHVEHPRLSLTILEPQVRVVDLTIAAPRVTDLRALGRRELRRLWLENMDVDGRLTTALEGLPRVEELTLIGEIPFGPTVLPDLPHLSRLRVPAFSEYRDEWIAFAVSRQSVACEFLPVKESAFKLRATALDVFRGVAIAKIMAGKKKKEQPVYEIAENVAGNILGRDDIDNHVLRDYLERAAKKAKKKLDISSEADTLIVHATSLEDARWAVDTLLKHFAGEPGGQDGESE